MKHYFVLLVSVICISGILIGNVLNRYDYNYLVYNDNYYIITNEPVE